MPDPTTRDPAAPDLRLGDPAGLGRSMSDVAERSQRIVADWLKRMGDEKPSADPLNIGTAFMEMTAKLMSNPARLMQAQIGFWQDYMTLWQNTARRMMGDGQPPPSSRPTRKDKPLQGRGLEGERGLRLHQAELPAQSARYVQDVVGTVEGLDRKTAQKVDFYSRQFIDAMSPSNFLLTNPEVLRKTAETGGENLLRGLNNLLTDLERGRGKLSHQDDRHRTRSKLGENIGVSPARWCSRTS